MPVQDERFPLHEAIHRGDKQRVTEVIKSGADVNRKDLLRLTPLHLAVQYGHLEIIRELLDAGAAANMKDGVGRTPIQWAEENQQEELVKMLLRDNTHADTILQPNTFKPSGNGREDSPSTRQR